MKKVIMILGYAFLVLLVLFAVGIAAIAVFGRGLDKESKAYVDAALPAIVSGWDVRELQKRASPEFDEAVDYDELEDDFETLSQLGRLEEYKGSAGDSNIAISLQYGCEITADYTAGADFEAGSAEMQISLIKHGGTWQILDLKINPQSPPEESETI